MPNHPNRNWRRVAQDAATRHIDILGATGMLPAGATGVLMTREQVVDLIRTQFVAGYDAGRKSRSGRTETPT